MDTTMSDCVRYCVRSYTQWLAFCGQLVKTALPGRAKAKAAVRDAARASGDRGRYPASICRILGGGFFQRTSPPRGRKIFSIAFYPVSACLSCPFRRKYIADKGLQRTRYRTHAGKLGKESAFCVRLRKRQRTQKWGFLPILPRRVRCCVRSPGRVAARHREGVLQGRLWTVFP